MNQWTSMAAHGQARRPHGMAEDGQEALSGHFHQRHSFQAVHGLYHAIQRRPWT